METEAFPSFASLLKGYRLARGLTQEALADFAALAAAEGKPERAVRLGGTVDRTSETIGVTLQPSERRRLER